MTEKPLVDGEKYGTKVPQVRSWVYDRKLNGIVETTPLQRQVSVNKKATTTYMVYIRGIYNDEK